MKPLFFIRTVRSFLRNKEYRELLYTTIFLIALGTVSYRYLEKWSWLDSVYFSVVTLTTVGYGDISPQTDGGKIFTLFYILLGIGIILSFINAVNSHYRGSRKRANTPKK